MAITKCRISGAASEPEPSPPCDVSFEAAGDDFVEVKMPLYPAIKLMDTVITDAFDFPTTEPTASQGVHTPGALLFSFSSEPTWTAIAMAERGGNTDAHAPHGEDSWGLWQIDVDPAGASADLWEWRKKVEDGTIKDTFDFQPQLTSEPTAAAGDDGQMFQQILQQLTQGGSPPDAFDFTTEPTAPEAGHVKVFSGVDMSGLTAPAPQERYTFVFDGNANTGDGGSIDGLAVDPTNPNTDDGLLLPAVQTPTEADWFVL